MFIRLTGSQNYQGTQAHQAAHGPADHGIEPPPVFQRKMERTGQIITLVSEFVHKAEKNIAHNEDAQGNHHVPEALLRQPQIVKSELALHPAEKHAKGTGAHHIGVYLKGSFVPARVFFVFVFMHNQALVSITMVISSIPDILYSFIHSVKP